MRGQDRPLPPALRPVLRALRAGEPETAVRCLVGAALDHHLPQGQPLAAWLTRTLGTVPTRQLIAACAEYPCFVCNGGYEVCENCAGQGSTRNTLCEPCLGFGVCHCKFCGGSGWVTINFVPQGLRFLTAVQRIRTARKRMARLVGAQATLDRMSRHEKHICRKDRVALILRWNRLLAVFENAVLALRLSCTQEPMKAAWRDQWISRCARYGLCVDRHIRQILGQLARHRQTSLLDAAFYAQLRQNPSYNAELEHPFLRQSMASGGR
jgi:hypothetical protein